MKNLIIAGSILLSATVSFAQENESNKKQVQVVTIDPLSQFDLTDEQQDKIQSLNKGLAKKNHAIQSNPKLSDEEKQKLLAKNEAARTRQLQTILSEEQFEKYKSLKQAQK